MPKALPERIGICIRKIASRLLGLNYNELTTAERQIVDLLIAEGYLKRNENGRLE